MATPINAPAQTPAADTSIVCELCDRDSAHMITLTEPDNSTHYICWDCLRRSEKGINVRPRWKRERRA